jgi:CheY-like chemotaxis protein
MDLAISGFQVESRGYFTGIVRDITERKKVEVALKEGDRRKDEFLAMLAHELRNPLAPISNALDVMRLSDDLSPATARMCEIMEGQVDHMVRLVDDLLDVSRITRGKIELRKESVDLAAIVASAVEASRPLIEAAGHRLTVSIPPEPMTLEADAVRLAQVIANLLNNAAKYTEEAGQIWLTVRREDGQAVVSVRDTGVGIPSEMLPHVFEAFTQADRSLSRAQGGLGIGLTLARSLVQMHGGTIEAHSSGRGMGSEFIVRLPLAQDAPHVPLSKAPAESAPARVPVRRVLVVDDTRASAYVLGKLLEKLGQQVRTAHDAASALESAQREPPDVVISDIAMPNMDGYELARRLRKEPGLEGTVLVALTGYGQDRDKQEAQQAGFDHHLVKPVSVDALYELLTALPLPRKPLFA